MNRFQHDTPAICDRCGRKCFHSDLTAQVIAGVVTSLMVCQPCLDQDHPQQFVNRELVAEVLIVDNPRPGQLYSQKEGGRFDGARLNMPQDRLQIIYGKVWGA